MRFQLRRAHVRYNDHFFGMADSGARTPAVALRILSNLPDGVTELCFHPATRRCAEIDHAMPHYRHEEELKALTSESLRRAAQADEIQRITFSDLE